MGIKPSLVGPETPDLQPLATWYADFFWFQRQKCVILYNPSTGYSVFVVNASRARIKKLPLEAKQLIEAALIADGFSADAIEFGLSTLDSPQLARTSDRKARSFVVNAIKDAEHAMSYVRKGDVSGAEYAARVIVSHGIGGPSGDPLSAMGHHLGEVVTEQVWYSKLLQDEYQIRIEIEEIKPPIWRRLTLPGSTRLVYLNLIIHGAFGWTNAHLHSFDADGQRFETNYPDLHEQIGNDELELCLADLLHTGGGRATYEYDFGDGWTHKIQLEERRSSDVRLTPACIAGARACPPEDCGGPGGYDRMLRVLANPGDEEYESITGWLPRDWNAEAFSVEQANAGIKDLLGNVFHLWR